MEAKDERLYPNLDNSLWTRSCDEEITSPVEGNIKGVLPPWLNGCLLRNGPGKTSVGSMKFNHLFDCSALLHRFAIKDGKVTYQCRFLRSETWQRNQAAGRIVVGEFGTKAVPDPCHTIYDRVSSFFNPMASMTDNSVVSVYPFGDEVYAFSENPFTHRIDPETLETLDRKNLDSLVVCHTSHPHVMANGDVFNVGISNIKGRIRHAVVKFPYAEKGDMFEEAQIVGSMSPRMTLNPAYMHSFGITENYFVMIEQPFSVSLSKFALCKLTNGTLGSTLQWYPENETRIVLIRRSTGEEVKRFRTETLFYVHVINCFEKDEILTVDLCAYKDAKIIDGMYMEALENMQSNAKYADWFRSRAKRIELPLDAPDLTKVEANQIAEVGCEMPRIHYEKFNGLPYRYFYAISSDVDTQNPGSLIKVDTKTGDILIWKAEKCFASEPVFIAAPNAKDEDDGVLLSALLWSGNNNSVTLLVINARNMLEMARADFVTPSPVPKDFHGWFLPDSVAK